MGDPDPWAAQDALARTTTWWGAASVLAGLGLAAARPDPWNRAFGRQNAGWGAVDLAFLLVSDAVHALRGGVHG